MKPKSYWAAVRKQKKESTKRARRALGLKTPTRQFNNVKTELDGYSFSSKLEAALYQKLKARLLTGEITEIQVQDHVFLTNARITYIVDFRITLPNGLHEWEEAKGYEDEKWPIKKRLWRHYGPGTLRIWKGSWENIKLAETIAPDLSGEACLFCGKSGQKEALNG